MLPDSQRFRRNQVVSVFDEWGLGYADGMPSGVLGVMSVGLSFGC